MKIETIFKKVQEGRLNEVPKIFLTQKVLLTHNPKEADNYFINIPNAPLISEIIQRGLACQLPQKVLTKSFVCKEVGYDNKTVMMELAENGFLHLVPKLALTKGQVNKKDSHGNNVLYHSCRTGEIKLIPKGCYTVKSLTNKNNRGRNCLHEAAKNGHLKEIPEKWITEGAMIGNNPQKIDPIDELYIHTIAIYKNSDTIEQILSTYQNTTLHYIEKKDLPINYIATRILRLRRARAIGEKISGKAKDLRIL